MKINISKAYVLILGLITFIQALLIFFPIGYIFSTVLAGTSILICFIFKDFVEDKSKKFGLLTFKLFIPLLILNYVTLLGEVLSNLSKEKTATPIILMLYTVVSLVSLAYSTNKEKKESLENTFNKSIFRKKKIQSSSNLGDVTLCVDMETKEPAVLPYKDRFLHMLILGPTGSGKTSQILLPMINQDMQGQYKSHTGEIDGYGITVIEPKGDLAEKVAAMGRHYGKEVVYFNPTHKDCPYFNPLYGPEDDVVENMATTFKMLDPDSPQFFKDKNENLIRRSIKVIKRLKGNSATFLDLSALVFNIDNQGKAMINSLAQLGRTGQTAEQTKENMEIADWFINEYFNPKSKESEHCSGVKGQISKLISNTSLRRVLNPPNGENDVDFLKIIEEGKVLAVSTAQGTLRDLSRFLGFFIILNFQSAVFKRPGNEDTRKPHFLYIDEFQNYSNPGFADMLTQGRSYRVASHLATQNRALMAMGGGRDGNNFVELVSTNARNVVIFPGGNSKDAKYYSDEFGEFLKVTKHKSVSMSKFNILYGFQKMNYPNETIREEEKVEARFSASDIIYNNFGEIIYRIVANNSVQAAKKGQVQFIPRELNQTITKMVDEYNEQQSQTEKIVDEQEIIYPDAVTKPVKVEQTTFEKEEFSILSEPDTPESEGKVHIPITSVEREPLILDLEEIDDLI